EPVDFGHGHAPSCVGRSRAADYFRFDAVQPHEPLGGKTNHHRDTSKRKETGGGSTDDPVGLYALTPTRFAVVTRTATMSWSVGYVSVGEAVTASLGRTPVAATDTAVPHAPAEILPRFTVARNAIRI